MRVLNRRRKGRGLYARCLVKGDIFSGLGIREEQLLVPRVLFAETLRIIDSQGARRCRWKRYTDAGGDDGRNWCVDMNDSANFDPLG